MAGSSQRRISTVRRRWGTATAPPWTPEGYLWNARFGGGCVIRFAPDGSVDARIDLPVTNPTSCCFGGDDLRTLYVTSARFGLTEAELAANSDEGALVALATDVEGLPVNRFAG